MDSGLISVIVPVYNTARWLPKCIDSILGQDYKNIEVILVNDASTDKSLDVCRRYADADKRIRIIDKPKNEGLEQARISGLSVARGEYVMHVDSDDWLNDCVLSKMLAKAEETGADYVEIGLDRVLDKYKLIKKHYPSPVTGLIEQPQLFSKYFISFFGVNILHSYICSKLYRKSTLDKADIKPLGIYMQEDVAYNMQLFPYLNKIYIMKDVGYNYRWGGTTSRYKPFISDYKLLYNCKKEMIGRYNPDKASYYVKMELKNVLRSEICQRIVYGIGGGRESLINWISEEINDPVYLDICDTASGKAPFTQALVGRDAEALYDICLKQVRRERPVRILKNVGFKLLNLI